MTTPTTLPEALTEIEELRGQVRELLRLLGQEAPQDTGAAGLSTSEIAALSGMPEISVAQVSLERKQTGRERTQIVAEPRNVIETAPDIIFKLDLHGNLAGWNKRLETVTGFVPEELNSRPAVSFAPECEREQTAAAIRHAFEQGYAELEGHLLTKTGRMIPYHWTGATIENHLGHVIGLIGVGRDRTVLKHAEEDLRTSEARFRELVETATDWMWEINELGAYSYCSPKIREVLGYEPDEAIGKTPFDFMPPEEAHRVAALFGPIAAARKPFAGIENINRRKDGQLVILECRGIPIFGADGLFRGYRGFNHDITERKRAESALQESESHFRAMIENSSDIITVLDLDGTIRFESPSFERLLGYAQHEIDGRIAFDFIHPDDLPAVIEKFQRIVQQPGETQTAEFRFRHQDGSWLSLEGVGRATCDSQGGGCVIVNSRDITERAQAEEALRQSEARLKEAQRIAHIGSWELDLVANRLTWSDEIYRIFEIDSETFGASYESFLQLVHPDDRSLVDRAYTESVTFRTPYIITHRLLMPDGRIKFVREQCETQYGRDGLALRSSGTVQDITKQKEAEEALAQNHALLTAIMDASIDFISIKDLQGRYVHINRAGAEAVGMPAEAVIGWDDVALWGGELAASRRPSDHFVTESGQTITVEEQGTLLDDIADYLTTKAPYRDSKGNIIGVIGIARNITEWKRVEEERQKALRLLTNVINATPDLIFVKDRDLRTILCNNSFAQAIGKPPEDLIGRSDIENGWDPELVRGNSDAGFPGYESDDRQALAGKVVHNSSDPAKVNGVVRIFDTYKVPLRDETGGVIGILGMSRDVTERKRMEEMLRQRERDLRAAVEERERISEDLHDGILQSIFAVGLGLESCRTLVSELPLPRKKTTAPLLAALNRAIGQLNHVMADVRSFIAGIESHVLQGGDVGSTLGAVVQSMCASNGTAWRVSIEEAAVRELSTEQAYHVMNIVREALSNSLRHSGAGRIALSLTRLRRSVRLRVTDNGKGFNPNSVRDVGHGLINMAARARKLGGQLEVHGKGFNPNSVRDVGHGLINMAARARKLGGQLEVRSRPRQGTKVLLDIPRRPVDE
ncbi:MAG: PAS domain S-box protein [Nitrospira sp.]|nr:PAS domain S-box protein [Nitrospira sp.]